MWQDTHFARAETPSCSFWCWVCKHLWFCTGSWSCCIASIFLPTKGSLCWVELQPVSAVYKSAPELCLADGNVIWAKGSWVEQALWTFPGGQRISVSCNDPVPAAEFGCWPKSLMFWDGQSLWKARCFPRFNYLLYVRLIHSILPTWKKCISKPGSVHKMVQPKTICLVIEL